MTIKTQKRLLVFLVVYVITAAIEYRRAKKFGAGTSPAFRFGLFWPYYELSGAFTRVTNAPKFAEPLASYSFTASGYTPQSAKVRSDAAGKLSAAIPEQGFTPGGSGVSGGGASGSY